MNESWLCSYREQRDILMSTRLKQRVNRMFVGKPKDRLALRAQHNNGRRKSCEGKAETLVDSSMGKSVHKRIGITTIL